MFLILSMQIPEEKRVKQNNPHQCQKRPIPPNEPDKHCNQHWNVYSWTMNTITHRALHHQCNIKQQQMTLSCFLQKMTISPNDDLLYLWRWSKHKVRVVAGYIQATWHEVSRWVHNTNSMNLKYMAATACVCVFVVGKHKISTPAGVNGIATEPTNKAPPWDDI